MKQRAYQVQVDWIGNSGEGTSRYRSYGRDHIISVPGKPQIAGSSDPAFRGDRCRYNPEELLLASLSSCHMLWYLHLCSVNRVIVVEYRDSASATLQELADGSGEFVRAVLKPVVKISADSDPARALELFSEAHRFCFIAKSIKFPVNTAPQVLRAAVASANAPRGTTSLG